MQQQNIETIRWKVDGRLLRDIKSGARSLFQSALFTKRGLPWSMELEIKGAFIVLYVCLRPFPKHMTPLNLFRACYLDENKQTATGCFSFGPYCEVDPVMEIPLKEIQNCQKLTFLYDFVVDDGSGRNPLIDALKSYEAKSNDSFVAANTASNANNSKSDLNPESASFVPSNGMNPETASFLPSNSPAMQPMSAMASFNPIHSMNPMIPENSVIDSRVNILFPQNAGNPINPINNSLNGMSSVSMSTVPTHWSDPSDSDSKAGSYRADNESPFSSGSSNSSNRVNNRDMICDTVIGGVSSIITNDMICDKIMSKLEEVFAKVIELENRVHSLEVKKPSFDSRPWSRSRSVSVEEKEGELNKASFDSSPWEHKFNPFGIGHGINTNDPNPEIESTDDFKVDDERHNERLKLKEWLSQKVRFPEYYALFIESGIEDLETAALLSEDTMTQIGIKKVGHRMKIMKEVQKLRVNEQDALSVVSHSDDEYKGNAIEAANGNDVTVKNWLESCKMGQYLSVFEANGIEDLRICRLLTMLDLTAMGIDKLGHRVHILDEVQKLQC